MEEFRRIQQIAQHDLAVFPVLELDQLTLFDKSVHNHTMTYEGMFSNLADVWLSQ